VYGYAETPVGARPPYAGFWIRVGGRLLDGLLYGLLFLVFAVPGIALIVAAYDECVTINDELYCPDGSPKGGLLAGGIVLLVIGFLVVAFLYVRALGRTGQTWGRKICGIKVVGHDDVAPLGIGRALGRLMITWVFGFVPLLPLLDVLWMLWDDQKQTLHDKVVNSIVVRV
jgi:uncharacterized RDD family membrane protein YckC